jgi:hypothetical protein
MGRMLVVILGAAVTLGAAWYYVNAAIEAKHEEQPEVPTRALENARESARRIEAEEQKRLDGIMQTTGVAAPAQE